jgi:hypothetical protein
MFEPGDRVVWLGRWAGEFVSYNTYLVTFDSSEEATLWGSSLNPVQEGYRNQGDRVSYSAFGAGKIIEAGSCTVALDCNADDEEWEREQSVWVKDLTKETGNE